MMYSLHWPPIHEHDLPILDICIYFYQDGSLSAQTFPFYCYQPNPAFHHRTTGPPAAYKLRERNPSAIAEPQYHADRTQMLQRRPMPYLITDQHGQLV